MASYPNLEATGQEYILEEQYKTLFGYPNGLVNGSLDLEVPGTSRPFILQNQIYSQDIPIQAPTDLGDTATTQIPPDTGVYVSYRKSINYPYLTKYYNVKLSYTNTYKPGVGALTWWFEADKTDGQRQVKYNILNKGVPNNLDPSNSYLPELKRNTVPLTLGNAQFPWTYNVNSGIVLFTGSSEYVTGDQKNNTPSKDDDIRMTFWRYEGATGTGSTGESYWEATGSTGIGYGALSVETQSNNSGSIYTQNILAKDAAANVNLYTNLITNGTLTIGSTGTNCTINSNTTFSQVPECGVTATSNNQLTTLGFNNGRYVDFTTNDQVISGNKNFSNTTDTNILITKDFRWNDASGGDTIQKTYLSGTTFEFVPLFNSNVYGFQCRDAGAITTTPLIINSASTTISNLLVSNNITAPITLGGTNNIYTNLDTATGGALINIGAIKNNINVKCNLNINESVYGTAQNTKLNQEGNSMRFTNNGSTDGDYIFTIIEGTTYNPFVINKTSVDIAGDANITGNLILYDTTPSTKTMTIGVLGNNMTFEPDNTVSSTYNFKVNDITGTLTSTPLTISTASTTISNTLVSNSQATFNNGATFNTVIPTTPITALSANELVNYTTLTTQGYTTLALVQGNANTFTSANIFTGNLISTTAIIVQNKLQFQNGTKQIEAYLTATGELTFESFFVSNLYRFRCINSTNTLEKFLTITFDKTTIESALEVGGTATFKNYVPECGVTATSGNQLTNKDYVDNMLSKIGSISYAVQEATLGPMTSFSQRIYITYITINKGTFILNWNLNIKNIEANSGWKAIIEINTGLTTSTFSVPSPSGGINSDGLNIPNSNELLPGSFSGAYGNVLEVRNGTYRVEHGSCVYNCINNTTIYLNAYIQSNSSDYNKFNFGGSIQAVRLT